MLPADCLIITRWAAVLFTPGILYEYYAECSQSRCLLLGFYTRHLHSVSATCRKVIFLHLVLVLVHQMSFFQCIFREEIAKAVMKVFHSACDPWGITVERVEVGKGVS